MYTKKNTKWLTGGQEEMENELEGENERKGERAVVSRGEKSEGGGRKGGGLRKRYWKLSSKSPGD